LDGLHYSDDLSFGNGSTKVEDFHFFLAEHNLSDEVPKVKGDCILGLMK